MHSKLILAAAVLLVVIPAVLSVAWRDCGSKAKMIKLDIPGCRKRHRCKLHRGRNSSLAITFETKTFVPKIEADVFGIIGGLPVPYPIADKDACKSKILPCPLEPQHRFTYSNVLFVEKTYPKISLVVKWTLKDAMKQNVICLLVPVKIV